MKFYTQEIWQNISRVLKYLSLFFSLISLVGTYPKKIIRNMNKDLHFIEENAPECSQWLTLDEDIIADLIFLLIIVYNVLKMQNICNKRGRNIKNQPLVQEH